MTELLHRMTTAAGALADSPFIWLLLLLAAGACITIAISDRR